MPAFKIDFHHHCSSDPVDKLTYTDFELIDQAVAMDLDAIAITPHGGVYHNEQALEHARSKGLLLIPGIEKMIEGYEIVLLNVSFDEIPEVFTFNDLENLRAKRGADFFAFAPHPFYPRSSCAGRILDGIAPLIDAVEYAHLYFSFYNRPNEKAVAWAEKNHKSVLSNSDSHSLSAVGRNYSIVHADKLTPSSLFSSIKRESPQRITRPYSVFDAIQFLNLALNLEWHHARRRLGF